MGDVFLNPESCVSILQGLISYHKRMMLGEVRCDQSGVDRNCPVSRLYDPYKEALQEAVRCIKMVYQLEDDCR